jgi:hypothetical protein
VCVCVCVYKVTVHHAGNMQAVLRYDGLLYIYIYICIYSYVCVCERERESV